MTIKISKLTRLEHLDAKLKEHTRQPRAPGAARDIRSVLSRRSALRADFGLPSAALEDSLRAYLGDEDASKTLDDLLHDLRTRAPARSDRVGLRMSACSGVPATGLVETEVPHHALAARLGEALRIYTRDVLLSKDVQSAGIVAGMIGLSIDCFDEALEECKGAAPKDAQLWMLAHRGAARALQYWVTITSEGTVQDAVKDPKATKIFDKADADFNASSNHSDVRPYEWSVRFRAYLYALRGEKGDFQHAQDLLKTLKPSDSIMQSALSRSDAMLNSYVAASDTSEGEREEAARKGLEAGAEAVTLDPEDYMAAYFTAVNWWWLALAKRHKADDVAHEPELYKPDQNHVAAIESARVRAHNSISQALAALIGLELMDAFPPHSCGKLDDVQFSPQALVKLAKLREAFELFPPDLETRSIFMRDPVWRTIQRSMPAAYSQLKNLLDYDAMAKHFGADWAQNRGNQ
jgi:hypothetical protein